jgi:hypothetical protein
MAIDRPKLIDGKVFGQTTTPARLISSSQTYQARLIGLQRDAHGDTTARVDGARHPQPR